jgi:hypothetical protein
MPKKKSDLPLTIKDDPSVGAEVLASAIVEIATAAKRLLNSRLTEEAVLVLLKHRTGIPMDQIKRVLRSAAELERTYVKR